MLIGSKFVPGTETAETVLDPKTEETIVELPEASAEQVDEAVDAAEKAFADMVAHDAGRALARCSSSSPTASRRMPRTSRRSRP